MRHKFVIKVLSLLLVCLTSCYCNVINEENALFARRDHLKQQALARYQSACLRLQNVANWMSVLLKLKSAWANTTANGMIKGLNIEGSQSKLPEIPERPTVKPKDSENCSSLQNFYVTFRTYIHFQAQLLQLKAVMGNVLLKSGQSKFDDKGTLFKDKIKSIDFLNRTAMEVFDKLIENSEDLTLEKENGFEAFDPQILQSSVNVLNLMNKATNTAPDVSELNEVQNIFQTGLFFQNIGRVLDELFF